MKLISFGFLHGPAPEADLTVDVRRYLYDPDTWDELLNQDGRDFEVRRFVFQSSLATDTTDWLSNIARSLSSPRRAAVTIAIGCAGGRHRSVAIVEVVAGRLWIDGHDRLLPDDDDVEVVHRDVERPRLPLHGKREEE